jgi:hypothetical protein
MHSYVHTYQKLNRINANKYLLNDTKNFDFGLLNLKISLSYTDKNGLTLQTLYNNYINIARKWYFVTLIKGFHDYFIFQCTRNVGKDGNI